MPEIWKDIPGYEGLYKVSDLGRVRSLDRKSLHPYSGWRRLRGKILSPHVNKSLVYIDLYTNKVREKHGVHQLVLLTFEGECPEGCEVCHYDGDGQNNHLTNLRYDTHSANELDKLRHGTKCQEVYRSDGVKFDSFKHAATQMNTNPSNISRSVSGGYRARGYYWYKTLTL